MTPVGRYVILVPELRSTHFDRELSSPDGRLCLRAGRIHPDMAGRAKDSDGRVVIGSAFSHLAALVSDPPDVLETAEPAWARAWPMHYATAALTRMSARMKSRPFRVVSYCIENLPIHEVLNIRRLGLPEPLARRLTPVLVLLWRRTVQIIDDLWFGTPAAEENYELGLGPMLRHRCRGLVPDALDPCRCDVMERQAGTVLYCAEFTERKGVTDLMQAWGIVAAHRPRSRLLLMGWGALTADVAAWAGARNDVEVVAHPSRAAIHAALRTHGVLALPSRRVPGWREQVGLPILEGIAHGCLVVTSTETGLAEPLRGAGHIVIPPACPDKLAVALTDALDRTKKGDFGRPHADRDAHAAVRSHYLT